MIKPPQKLAPRSKLLNVAMSVPVALFFVLLVLMLLLPMCMQFDGEATGQRVRMVFSGDCAAQAQETIDFRMEKIGMGDPVSKIEDNRLVITGQLIGEEDDMTAIPKFLVQQGRLEFKTKDKVFATNEHIQRAAFYMDDRWNSYTIISLQSQVHEEIKSYVDEYPLKTLNIFVDGKLEVKRPNTKKIAEDEIRLVPQLNNAKKQFRQAVDWSILFSKAPLPCQLELDKIEPI